MQKLLHCFSISITITLTQWWLSCWQSIGLDIKKFVYQPCPLGCWICWRREKPNGTSQSVCRHLPFCKPVRARWCSGTDRAAADPVLVIQSAAPSSRLRVDAASGACSSRRVMEPDPLYGFGWQCVSSWNRCFDMMVMIYDSWLIWYDMILI